MPTVLVSTVPEEVTVSPPSAVAPASEYDEPNSTVAGLSPSIVITGKTVSGGVGDSSDILSIITIPRAASITSMIESSASKLERSVPSTGASSSDVSSR